MTKQSKYSIAVTNFNFVLVYVIMTVYYIWHGIISGQWFTTAATILLILTYFGLGRIAEIIQSRKNPEGKNG